MERVIHGEVPEEESWCGDIKVMLQSSYVRSSEKAMATKTRGHYCNKRERRKSKKEIKEYQLRERSLQKKRGPEYARSDCSEARSWTTRPNEKKGNASRCRRRIAKKKIEVNEMLSLRRGRS